MHLVWPLPGLNHSPVSGAGKPGNRCAGCTLRKRRSLGARPAGPLGLLFALDDVSVYTSLCACSHDDVHCHILFMLDFPGSLCLGGLSLVSRSSSQSRVPGILPEHLHEIHKVGATCGQSIPASSVLNQRCNTPKAPAIYLMRVLRKRSSFSS
ncbi:uncharacterized protein PGTG_15141 [Puccinia graminis f. sp. tritici CRL 75-36-700-3]|uniref:Uncharacterized protein n=1 Tax=Puccinia graminis f. sp. tritici (strain CRL 75-36-700-3 / race SCCL) TaxID=418459 RepID=E3KXI0_PUCGT|nr:uncharacterized protein PGTG_15141 [Puccinia graminis f. sp. tritici CRL 75-36-700-3]EFP88938.1 hypothetical protein PGTG_15141 [Puccinia graminis f. sp. tritici CRL 75-36-700-3]